MTINDVTHVDNAHSIGQCQRPLRSPKTSLVTVYRLYIVAFQVRWDLNE